ncbi:MAG: SocA family protein [Bacteroidetes bacterium]|nr:SocA family protein [Bacteroidota bacterium]
MNSSTSKIINSILFFAFRGDDNTLDRLKLMKLLWLSDRIHLNKYGRLITRDKYSALPHGPVPSNTIDISRVSIVDFFTVNGFKIKALKDFDKEYFSNSDIKVFEYVWNKFGSMDSIKLRDLSHEFPEWKRYEKELLNESMPNSYEMVITDFFEDVSAGIFNDFITAEEVQNSISRYNYNSSLQSILKD